MRSTATIRTLPRAPAASRDGPRRRSGPRYVELRNLREDVQQLLGHAIGEVILVGLATHVRERQHGNGRMGVRRHVADAVGRLTLEIPAQGESREHRGCDVHADRRTRAAAFGADAIGRHVEHPGNQQRDRKAEHRHQDEHAQRPRRRIERGESDRHGLHGKPGDDEVGRADLEHLASFEFGKQLVHEIDDIVSPSSRRPSQNTGLSSSADR